MRELAAPSPRALLLKGGACLRRATNRSMIARVPQLLLLLGALFAASAAAQAAADPTVVKNAAVLLESTIGMSSTITIGNAFGIAELKGTVAACLAR